MSSNSKSGGSGGGASKVVQTLSKDSQVMDSAKALAALLKGIKPAK